MLAAERSRVASPPVSAPVLLTDAPGVGVSEHDPFVQNVNVIAGGVIPPMIPDVIFAVSCMIEPSGTLRFVLSTCAESCTLDSITNGDLLTVNGSQALLTVPVPLFTL